MPPCKRHFLSRQRGVFLVLTAVLFIVFLALCGLLLDVGMIYNARAELKAATNSAALSGAVQLEQPSQVNATVQNYLKLNPVQNTTPINPLITLGRWDDKSQSFSADDGASPTAVKVTASYSGTYYFGRVFNLNSYTLTSTSIASIIDGRPLKIMIVADISANMSLASQLQGVGTDDVTQASVLNNITQIYNELKTQQLLNSAAYGYFTWDQLITSPQIKKVLAQLGLDDNLYPYSGFTWTDYIKYVQKLSVANAAYKNHFGFLTLINFWQEQAYAYSQTPILNRVSEQPLQAVKNSVSYLADQLDPSYDTLGLTVISPANNLVTGLTANYRDVVDQLNNYQAGAYGANNGTLLQAVYAAISGLASTTEAPNKKVMLILANGQTLWNKKKLPGASDLSALTAANIYVYRLVIGPDAIPAFNSLLVTGTGGKAYAATLGSTDYTTQMDAFYNDLKIGPPRLVQ